ncbi:MAG: NYN domain-containing protein [Pirellulales bacterium]
MTLLIDGYNLLHVTGITGLASRKHSPGQRHSSGKRGGPTSLQRSREALLRFLAASIDEIDLPRTTVVFDANDVPPGLPKIVDYHGMTILYAVDYADADSLIEELIQSDTSPRSLLVVSSDHRIQRAARRRRAKYIDSDLWYGDLCRRRSTYLQNRSQQVEKPTVPLSDAEVAYWSQQFVSDTDPIAGAEVEHAGSEHAGSEYEEDEASDSTPSAEGEDWANPFPPGYGDDLLEE